MCCRSQWRQKIARLDDDLILVAGAVPRALTERFVIWVRRAGQDLAKAALCLWPLRLVKPNRVLVFLIKADRALCACDFVGIAHLAPGRDAAEIHLPHGAVCKAAHHLAVIVVGDRAAGAC